MRVLMLSLDGFDMDTARSLGLPTLSRLADTAAHGRLDSGNTYLTGLAGEHFSNGLHPSSGGRQSAVRFDPQSYRVTQRNESLPAAFGGVDTVVFDPCYFDLARAPETVRGIVDWGAHDPGGPPQQRPDSLRDEIIEKFGDYPARPWIYANPWPSSERCEEMATDLVGAVRARSAISRWLLSERLPDWTIAAVTVSEGHGASEGLFHGADANHPLAVVPSAPAAGEAISDVYHAIDTLVAELLGALPDVLTMVFTPHGMGANNSDIASMVLLGELMACWSGDTTPDLSFPTDEDPLSVTDEGADLIVHWHGTPFGLEHDQFGRIGPIPARRTGGHRSPYGAVFVTGPDVEPVDLGELSPFDLVPTAFELTGCASPWELSGRAFTVPTTA